MKNFNKGSKFGEGRRGGKGSGGRSFGGNRGGNRGFGGGRDGGRQEMHKAICSDCNNNCEVPFRPTGDKPIFCSDCFRDKRDDNPRNSRGGGGRGFGDRNSRPSFDNKRPYQSDGNKDAPNYKAQFEMLNTKLDKILKILIPAVSEEAGEIGESKSKKFQKGAKKGIDTDSLKKALTKTINKKSFAKKKTAIKKKKK